MKGYQLTFYTLQSYTHDHRPMHQWLMDLAQSMKIRGATVFTAQQGVGVHHRLHSARFFELAEQPIEVTMVVSEQERDAILQRMRSEPGLRVFYSCAPLDFGTIGEEQ